MMKKFTECGYIVKENGPVYFTLDMDKTAKWFEDVLGWYSEIDERNEDGKGCYGCVYSIPTEIEVTHLAPFTGIHMFYGEPKQEMVCFMHVQGIEKMYEYIRSKGWEKITEIETQPWGGKTCTLTTIDGSIIHIFE